MPGLSTSADRCTAHVLPAQRYPGEDPADGPLLFVKRGRKGDHILGQRALEMDERLFLFATLPVDQAPELVHMLHLGPRAKRAPRKGRLGIPLNGTAAVVTAAGEVN